MRLPALLLLCLCWSVPSSAASFTYEWSSILNPCTDQGGVTCDQYNGVAPVFGLLTFDTDLGYTAFSFGIDGASSVWASPVLPDPVPGDAFIHYVEDYGDSAVFGYFINIPEFYRWTVNLVYDAPITGQFELGMHGDLSRWHSGPMFKHSFDAVATLTSTGQSQGQVIATPEPSTLLLTAPALWWLRKRRPGSPEHSDRQG